MSRYASHRQQLQGRLVRLVFLLILSACTSAPPSLTPTSKLGVPLRPFVDTWNNIHLFQTFDYSISSPANIAKRYDSVWGAEVDHVAAWRSGNPNIFISYYLPFHREHRDLAIGHPLHDLAYWKAVHPDWILYKCDRVTPAYKFGDPSMPLDFANPALVSWQIQTYAQPASERGYDGIAADNVGLENLHGACGVYIKGKWVQRYTGQLDDPRWSADVIIWLTRMQQALHHLQHPLALIPNLSLGKLSPSDPMIQQAVSHTDGVLDEDSFTRSGAGYLTGNDWIQTIRFMQSLQQQYKAYYIINQLLSVGRAEIQWAVASYLMGKEHSAALFISTVQGYGGNLWNSAYDAQIGSPSGPMYQMQGIYARNYSHGLSIVNPSATVSYTVILGPGDQYRDLYGTPVSGTITMPPHSGMVLLTSS